MTETEARIKKCDKKLKKYEIIFQLECLVTKFYYYLRFLYSEFVHLGYSMWFTITMKYETVIQACHAFTY
jgi:hypothetical protein